MKCLRSWHNAMQLFFLNVPIRCFFYFAALLFRKKNQIQIKN